MAIRSRSHAALRALLACCCVLPLLQACGGRSDTEEYLFGADEPVTVGASSSIGGSVTAGRPGVGGAVGVGASAGVGATSTIGGATSTAGQPSVGGTGVAGSGQGGVAAGGAGGAPGVAGAPDGPSFSCGADVCDADTQSCCGAFGVFQCIAKGGQCQGAVLACTNNADCGADLCCFSVTGDASAASTCQPRCNTMGGSRDRQLCQVADDCREPFRFCTPSVFGVNICTRFP
jgi:hypothetical protein